MDFLKFGLYRLMLNVHPLKLASMNIDLTCLYIIFFSMFDTFESLFAVFSTALNSTFRLLFTICELLTVGDGIFTS